jgi:hypothetical protein
MLWLQSSLLFDEKEKHQLRRHVQSFYRQRKKENLTVHLMHLPWATNMIEVAPCVFSGY